MRVRIRRLRSLLVGIVRSLGQATRPPPPSGGARVATQGLPMPIRESAPLCLTRTLAGAGPTRLGVDHRQGNDGERFRRTQDGRETPASGARPELGGGARALHVIERAVRRTEQRLGGM